MQHDNAISANFMLPFTAGDVVAEASVLHCGNRTALVDVALTDGRGRLLAKGSAAFLRVKPA